MHVIKSLNVHDRDLQLLAEKIPSLIVRERQPNTFIAMQRTSQSGRNGLHHLEN